MEDFSLFDIILISLLHTTEGKIFLTLCFVKAMFPSNPDDVAEVHAWMDDCEQRFAN